ncbi:sel1 repeat family protein [Campylobacter sp. JMF_02 ED1]|uniref:tetratricopeptide repeat protein n=1 Tax=unclassified Campylobacter TaxID=2593542 RepID=UPI0022EA0826|nr:MULTISPECIES: tetratricopeptide repeat protein [unclassified Campylobacter]MDA3048945.1 sel1 repeat family protein [Campylobacter sp. JMF_15 NE4]MDA3050344.1 sel1 repeat family protein [Campylobacter sp. JMF_02 ED1]
MGCKQLHNMAKLKNPNGEIKTDDLRKKINILVNQHQKKCEAKNNLDNAFSCEMVADFYSSENTEPNSVLKLYERACELDLNTSCHKATNIYLDRDNPDDVLSYRKVALKAYESGYKKAFENLEKIYKMVKNETLCNDENNATACAQMGDVYYFGLQADTALNRVNSDFNKAQEFYKKACDLDEMHGCYKYGKNIKIDETFDFVYKKRKEFKDFDFDKIWEPLLKACNGGIENACDAIGSQGILTNSVNACENNNSSACAKAGELYYNGFMVHGFGVPGVEYKQAPKKRTAKEFFQKACDLENAYGCEHLAEIYELGEVTKQDHDLAEKLHQKAHDIHLKDIETLKKSCDAKNKNDCQRLGYEYIEGNYRMDKNTTIAHEYFGMACELSEDETGNDKACQMYKKTKSE